MNKLLIGFLASISLLFFSCEKDEINQETPHTQKIEYNDFLKDISSYKIEKNPIFWEAIFNKKPSTTKTQNNNLTFEISTNDITKVISTNNLATYTINVKTNDNDLRPHYYRLVLITQNQNYDFKLLKFIPNVVDDNLPVHVNSKYNGTIENISFSENPITLKSCSTVTYREDYWAPCVKHGHYDATNGCDGGHWETRIVTQSFCTDISGGGGWTSDPYNTGGGGSYEGSYPIDPAAYEELESLYLDFVTSELNYTQRKYINLNLAANNTIKNYLFINSFSSENKEFVKQMIDYCKANPNTTWEQIKNWFFTKREGKDGDYDANFWENPNIVFPQQTLPTFQAFDDAYPRTDGVTLAALIGGDILTAYNENPAVVRGFCALKVSRALNYCGINIPSIVTTNGNYGTVKGEDGKYYFLNAKSLNAWMRKTFGVNPQNPNHIRILGSQGGVNGINFPTLTTGIKGIYSMVSSNSQWASGHADLIDNGICVFGCHFYDSPPAPIDYIDIWKLN